MAELDAALTIHDKHSHGPNSIAAAVDAAEERFEVGASTLAAELLSTGGEYLLDTGFSAADILFVATMDWAEHPDYQWCSWTEGVAEDTIEKANLREYLQRCRGRPAYRIAKEKGGWLSNDSKL